MCSSDLEARLGAVLAGAERERVGESRADLAAACACGGRRDDHCIDAAELAVEGDRIGPGRGAVGERPPSGDRPGEADGANGGVLDEVDALRLRERTIVMLISDNGAFMLPGRGLEVASIAPLRSGGTTSYEGGTRVPALFRWPGRIPAGRDVRAMLTQLDVLPLCLAAAGAPRDTGRVLDGRDPLPALTEDARSQIGRAHV